MVDIFWFGAALSLSGLCVLWLGVCMIIYRTKITRAQLTLVMAKQEVQDILQLPMNNPYPLVKLDKDGRIVFLNSVASHTFPDLLIGDAVHPAMRGIKDLIAQGASVTQDIVVSEKTFMRNFIPVYATQGHAFAVNFTDISERKIYERELKEAHQQAEISRVAAEQAKEARGEFLANMSHELRTPMNGIIGLTDILMEQEQQGERSRILAAVHQSARNLLTLLNDILDFSKIEAGELAIEKIPFDIRRVIEDVRALYASLASQKGLEMRVKIEEGIPLYLIGDPVRLQQILNNLISNAIKFTHEGSVTLYLSGSYEDSGLYRCRLSIEDTGIGIPKDKQAAVFEKFQQVDASTARKYGGTGLGLSITRNLVSLMGGVISIQSEEGRGTVFNVELIFSVAHEDEYHRAHPAALESEKINQGLSCEQSILIVDDHPVNLMFLRKALEKAGFKYIDEASSGAQAVELFGVRRHEIVIIDCQMPEMDGFEATRRIREISGSQAVPLVIAATANAMKGAEERCLASGMNDYISKPIEREKLYSLLKKWVSHEFHTEPIKKFSDDSISGDLPVLDWQKIKEFSDGDKTFEEQIISIFTSNLENDIGALEVSLRQGDYAQWDSWVHKLYGACSHIGANSMASVCDEAQSLFPERVDLIPALHGTILMEYQKVQKALAAV